MEDQKPLIEIKRDDKSVVINFTKGPLDSTYYFTFNCQDAHYAELLRLHFKERLKSIVQLIRQEEYDRGYKDGRGKKAKKGWFSIWLKGGNV